MAGADVAPSSGVSGGMGAVLRGYREEKARQFGDAASNASSGDIGMDIAKMNWGQRRVYMKNQDTFEAMRQQRRAESMQDLRNATVLDTAAEVFKGREASKVKKGEARLGAKLDEQKSQADFGRAQQAATSERIYQESTKDTQFAREQKGLNAEARRQKASRAQAFAMGGGAPAESVSFGRPGAGGKSGGGNSDTIKFSVT